MNLKYTISIENNTNFIISSSEDKFANINDNSLIRIGDDNILYSPIKKESFLFIKNFKCDNSKILIINEEIGINIQSGDIIKISYKEFEAKFISNIIDPGIGYISESIINAKNGISSIDPKTGKSSPTIITIEETTEDGKVIKLNINDAGKYINYPENPISFYSKFGNNLKVDIKYMELSNRSFIERTVNEIYFSEGKTFIILDYCLPQYVNSGKLSVEKQKLTISPSYFGSSGKNINYEVFNYFTPNIGLPLLLKGSLSSEIILNKALLKIDEEIGNIKKKLNID